MLYVHEQVKQQYTQAQDISITLMGNYGLAYRNSLQERLLYLLTYGNFDTPDHCHVVLGHDHVDLSFSVAWYFKAKDGEGLTKGDYAVQKFPALEGYKFFMNGGLIFTAPKGYPSDVEKCGKHDGWSIHT